MKTRASLILALLIPLFLVSCAAIETPDSPYDAPKKKTSPLEDRLEMATAYQNHGLVPRAIDEYKEVLKLDPVNVKALKSLAGMTSALKRYDESETYYKKALEVEPDQPDYYNGLAWVYFKGRKDYAAAHEMVDKALAAESDRHLLYLEMKGLILAAEQKHEDAIRTFKASLAECEQSKLAREILMRLRIDLHKNIGRAYRATGNDEEARAHLQRALDLAPPGMVLDDR